MSKLKEVEVHWEEEPKVEVYVYPIKSSLFVNLIKLICVLIKYPFIKLYRKIKK
jgi:hypothetical protein